jgi:hypothetical protein
VFFFADADLDLLNNRPIGENCAITDGRDLESYFLIGGGVEILASQLLGLPDNDAEEIHEQITRVARPIGILRCLSDLDKMRLPFQNTFANDSGKRFTKKKPREPRVLMLENMIDSLLKRATDLALSVKDILDRHVVLSTRLARCENYEIVQGKDLIAVISWYLDMPEKAVSGLVFATIYLVTDDIRALPALAQTERWVRAA